MDVQFVITINQTNVLFGKDFKLIGLNQILLQMGGMSSKGQAECQHVLELDSSEVITYLE